MYAVFSTKGIVYLGEDQGRAMSALSAAAGSDNASLTMISSLEDLAAQFDQRIMSHGRDYGFMEMFEEMFNLDEPDEPDKAWLDQLSGMLDNEQVAAVLSKKDQMVDGLKSLLAKAKNIDLSDKMDKVEEILGRWSKQLFDLVEPKKAETPAGGEKPKDV